MQLQEKSIWFNKNFVANPTTNAQEGCAGCFFRAHKAYCYKVTCTYLLQNGLQTFQWQPVHNHFIFGWQELSEFFGSTYTQDVKDISRQKIEQTISKQKCSK